MAFAAPGAGSRFKVTAYFTDEQNQVAKNETTVPFDTDIATTLANVAAQGTLLQTASGAKVDKLTVTIEMLDAVAPAAAAGSRIAEVAQLSMNLDQTGQGQNPVGNYYIPAAAAGIRVGDVLTSTQIDPTDTGVTNIVDNFKSTGDLLISDGQNALSLKGAKILHVRRKVQS